jgi:hypothetical protein
MDLSIQHFIFNRPTLKAVLQDHQGLGAHTDIVEITATTTTTYIWVHQSSRPFGHVYQRQCPLCSRLSTIGPKFDNQGRVYFKCSFNKCEGRSVFQLPEGTHWLYNGPPVKGDSRGTWLCSTKSTSEKVKVDEKKVAVEEAKGDLGIVVDDGDDAWEMEIDHD